MIEKVHRVDHLKKVTLNLEVRADSKNPVREPAEVEFIFGIGSGGLTPFEYELADREEGEEILLRIQHSTIPQVFQHLPILPRHLPEELDPVYLKVRVVKVAKADQREVIKALAEIAECGDQCCGH
jgi:hypothetical protein